MSADRMNADDPLRALADMLDVEPSREFGVRVRQGVEADRAARRRAWRYLTMAAVPVAVAVVLVVGHVRPVPPEEQPGDMVVAAPSTGAGDPSGAVPDERVSTAKRVTGERGTPSGGEARGGRARVEAGPLAVAPIIVPRGQLEGVRQLASAVASGRVRFGPSLASWTADVDPEVAPLPPPDPIRVAALHIEPIVN